jgi:hypothetical protein
MSDDANPFDSELEGSPFGDPRHVICSQCGGEVPREEASFKVKTIGYQDWGSLLVLGPFGSVMAEEKQQRGYYCSLCLRLLQERERRKRMFELLAIAGIIIVLVVWYLVG